MKNRSLGIFALLAFWVIIAQGQTLEFSSEVYSTSEGQGTVTLTVVKSGDASGPITVHYATKDDGPGEPFATPSKDFVAAAGDLTFAPGETSKEIQITIKEDAIYENSEIFHVVLSNPTGGAAVRQPSSAQVTIIDNDPAPTFQFSSANYSTNENAGAATLTITKTGATETLATVYYKTRDGTATAPSDYTFTGDDLTASVSFAPAENSKEIEIPVHDDSYLEPNETFQVFFTVVMGGTPGAPDTATVTIVDDDPEGSPPPAKALNISTRAPVQTGPRILIGGFIITGNDTKFVVIRGLGPSLSQNGIPSNQALADPMLQLNTADGSIIGTNDNWRDDPATRRQIEGTIYQPKDEREAVILAALLPGAYTAFVTGRNQNQGIGLVEVYDLNGTAGAELSNVSTRGHVGQENDVMIGGFILGNENGSVQVAIRGLGPSLANYGLSNVLPDPALELHDANGTGIAVNDDWESDTAAAAQLTTHGLALSNPKESGLFLVLPPGQFTAILHGKNIGAGLGLVEVYNLK